MLWGMCAALGCGATATPTTRTAPMAQPAPSTTTAVPAPNVAPTIVAVPPPPTAAPPPPIKQPDIAVSAPVANAVTASNPNWPVIIPANTDDSTNDDSADPLVALRATIAAEMVAARQRKAKPAPTVVVYLDTTDDYGCLCPPFVLAPFYNAGEGGFIWPKFARGNAPAPTPKGGLLRVAGHFEGRAITGYQAEGRRAPKVPAAADEAEPDFRLERHPAFFVEAWCFAPSATISQSTLEVYNEQLTALAKQGRFCVGSKFPDVTP